MKSVVITIIIMSVIGLSSAFLTQTSDSEIVTGISGQEAEQQLDEKDTKLN